MPAISLSNLTEAQKRTYVLADNNLAERAGWDREMLAIELGELSVMLPEVGLSVDLPDFEVGEVDAILADAEEEKAPIPTMRSNPSAKLAPPEPRRLRDKAHLKFVASQPCLVCGRQPSDPHHLRFAQPPAIGRKISDEFTAPLCRGHHRQLHQAGNEVAWLEDLDINSLEIAKGLWEEVTEDRWLSISRAGGGQADEMSDGKMSVEK